MNPLANKTEPNAVAFLMPRLLCDADVYIATFNLEAEEAVGADRENRIDDAG
jgi:hypothetical protein